MSPRTVSLLLDVNRRFYHRFAAEFAATRRHGWPGWKRIVQCASRRSAVLDVGCGNGRFLRYLADHNSQPMAYVGVDSCRRLPAEAATQRPTGGVRWLNLDLVRQDLLPALAGDRFDLIVVFDLPGETTRRRFLRRLVPALEPSGLLAVSLWRIDRNPGFERKLLPWTRYNRSLEPSRRVEPADLDSGDHLLTWAGDETTPRYCHFPDFREIAGWALTPGLKLVERFESDGPTGHDNLYLVFEKAPGETTS